MEESMGNFRSLRIVLVFCCLLTSSILQAQGRISGLKISNSSVVGTTLSFDVTMSIDVLGGSPNVGFLGNHYHHSSSTTRSETTVTTVTVTSISSYQCSTHTFTNHDTCTGPSPTFSTYPCNTTTSTTFNTCTTILSSTYQNFFNYFYTTNHTTGRTIFNPRLPAIDWGDGNTITQTTLPLLSSGPPNVYRRSFSHSYASSGGYSVKVGAFGQDLAPTLNGGNVITVNVPDTFVYHEQTLTRYEKSDSTTNSNFDSSTVTIASPNNSVIGVTVSSSFGVPVELQSFSIADASESLTPARHPSPINAAGLGLGIVLAALGFILLRRQ